MLFSKLKIPKNLKGDEMNQGKIKMEKDWSILLLDKDNKVEKTELLMQVIQVFEERVMWYHLDFSDNKESAFLDYVKENFKKAMKGIDFGDFSINYSLPVPFCYLKCMEHILNKITAFIASHDEEYCLIFDGLHEIENKIILKMMQQLVDNKPKSLKLVIISEELSPELVLPQKNSFYAMTIIKKEKAAVFVSFFNGLLVKNQENGKEVCWRTKKEKQLFAYFFSLNEKPVERSHLLEILWNDHIPENGIAMLHNMIYHIRKELERLSLDNVIHYKKKNTG